MKSYSKTAKAIAKLKARLQQLTKLAAKVKKYIVEVLDLEAKVEALLKQQLGAKRKVVVYAKTTEQITFVGSWEQFTYFIDRYPKRLKKRIAAFWVNVVTSEVIQEIPIT